MSNRDRPAVVMVVLNDVSGDTRVKKSALTLARAGCSVTVYGFSKDGERWETAVGSVRIIRLSDPQKATTKPKTRSSLPSAMTDRVRTALERAGARRETRRARMKARVRRWKGSVDQRQERIGRRGRRTVVDHFVIASLWYRIKGLRLVDARRELVIRLLLSLARGEGVGGKLGREVKRRIHGRSTGGPEPVAEGPFAHIERFGQALLEELRGKDVDAIHAHDFFAIGVAHRAADALSKPGEPVRWIYDAHEYVRGLDHFKPERRAAALALEAEHIQSADRVITVTPELAERLQVDYGLPRRPDVVLNAPALLDRWALQETVRSHLGLDEEVNLLVYAGQVKAARDIHTLVAALEFLPRTHLALITANEGAYLEELADVAASISATERYHVLPYVASHEVSAFLSDATVGVVPLAHYGNAEVALPTKVFEFLHACLPMAVSDTRAMSRFVTELGVGEVFTAGDAGSLAAAVDKVLEQPDAYRQPVRSDPGILDRYSWQRQEQVLINAYSNVLGEPLSGDGPTPTSLDEGAVPAAHEP